MNGHRHAHRPGPSSRRDGRGVILLITLVVLVILATLGYTLTVRVAARRHRDQYIVDYCIAKHACASGLKYALSSMKTLEFSLISRPNEPDFSDVFAMSEPEYQKLLDQMALSLGNAARSQNARENHCVLQNSVDHDRYLYLNRKTYCTMNRVTQKYRKCPDQTRQAPPRTSAPRAPERPPGSDFALL